MKNGDTGADVVVIGGGAIGVCCALELSRRGARVALLERGAELAWGCSAGNAGLICPSHGTPLANPAALRQGMRWMFKPDSPFYLRPRPGVVPWLARFVAASTPARAHASEAVVRRLSTASLAIHEQLAAEGLDSCFEQRGSLNVYETEEGLEAGKREALSASAAGLPVEVLGRAEAQDLEPAVGGSAVGAVYYSGDAHCDPLRFVRAAGAAAAYS